MTKNTINTIKNNVIIAMFIISKVLIIIGIVYSIFAPQASFSPKQNTISYGDYVEVEFVNMSVNDLVVSNSKFLNIEKIDDTHCIITLNEDVSGYITLSSQRCDHSYIIDIV